MGGHISQNKFEYRYEPACQFDQQNVEKYQREKQEFIEASTRAEQYIQQLSAIQQNLD